MLQSCTAILTVTNAELSPARSKLDPYTSIRLLSASSGVMEKLDTMAVTFALYSNPQECSLAFTMPRSLFEVVPLPSHTAFSTSPVSPATYTSTLLVSLPVPTSLNGISVIHAGNGSNQNDVTLPFCNLVTVAATLSAMTEDPFRCTLGTSPFGVMKVTSHVHV